MQDDIKEGIEIRLPIWHLESHKGQQGRILTIGGSPKYHGAPILTLLGAEVAGADLITAFMPQVHIESAKRYSLNVFLNPFKLDEFGINDVKAIGEATKNNDVMILGNGIGSNIDVKKGVLSLLSNLEIPTVLDAEALFPEILDITTNNRKGWILTPHKGEFERLFNLQPTIENVAKMADKYECTICVKGRIDFIATPGQFYKNRTGVPQMRVGGTGDVLAGIIGAYYSMGLDAFEATKTGAFLWGKCGEYLLEKMYPLSAYQMVKKYRRFISKMIVNSGKEKSENYILSGSLYN